MADDQVVVTSKMTKIRRNSSDSDIDVGDAQQETTNCLNLNRSVFKMLVSLALSFMGLTLALLSMQIFNELGSLYEKDDECVPQYIPVSIALAFRGSTLVVFSLSIILILLGCYGVRCLGWGLLLELLGYFVCCCIVCQKVGGHRKKVYWILITVNTCLMIVLFALGIVLDAEFDNIKQNCSEEAVTDKIEELDREFLTMNIFALVGGIMALCACLGCLNSDIGRCATSVHDCIAEYTNDIECECECDECCDKCCDCDCSCCDSCDCDCDCGGGDCLMM